MLWRSPSYNQERVVFKRIPNNYAPLHKKDNNRICRRGIAVFILEKYSQNITKVSSSPNFDIIWLRMATKYTPIYLCFFYAPGEHHREVLRTEFYNVLQKDFDNFNSLGKVFILGDSNARLGRYLNDRNIHGQLVSNKNKPFLLGL